MNDTDRVYDVDALEFAVVRNLVRERLVTPLGRTAVDALAPLPDAATVRARLAAVGALAERSARGDSMPASGIVEVRSWLDACFAGEHQLQARDLADLKRVLRAAERCRRWLLLPGDERCAALLAGVHDLSDLVEELEAIVDDRGEVLGTASQKLAQVRAEIETARAAVDHAVARLLADGELRRYLQSPEPSWRHGRPVLQVKQEHRHRVPGVLHDRSQSGVTLFIEPDLVVEAANRLSDALAAEHREIQVVLANAARGLRRSGDGIGGAVEFVAALDAAHAAARLCSEEGFVVPEVGDGGPLCLVRAQHPILLRQKVDAVPLDVRLGDPNPMLVVTGPNTGGKTVVLKTIGLLTLMALSGLPIPAAAGSRFPFLCVVHADIGDEQGISQNLSTFSSHVQRIARCLGRAGPRALLLLDELGAGTDPEEGGVLGYAVLEALVAAGAFAVVTTHLGRLKDFAYQHKGAENGSMAFDGRTLQPLYRLDIGIPGNSHALDIATRVGMPEPVVRRARELLGTRDRSLEEVIQRVQDARRDAEQDRQRTAAAARAVAAQQDKLQEQLQAAGRQASWLQEEKDALLGAELRQLRQDVQPLLKALAQAPGAHGERARELAARFEQLLRDSAVHRRRMAFCAALRKGDPVFLPRFGRAAAVHKVDSAREIVVVDYNRARLDVPFEDISWLQPLDRGDA